jgi:hypothetical protein
MPIIAMLAAILAALIYAAERIAFACLLWFMGSWLWKASTGVRAWIVRHAYDLHAHWKTVHQAALYWLTMRQVLRALRT